MAQSAQSRVRAAKLASRLVRAAKSPSRPVRAAKRATEAAPSKVRRGWAWELTGRPLALMQENGLACRPVRVNRIFWSPEQPPEPSLPLGVDTRDLPYNRGKVTPQS